MNVYLRFLGHNSFTQAYADPMVMHQAIMASRSKQTGLVLADVFIGHDLEQMGHDHFHIKPGQAHHQRRGVTEPVPLPEKDRPHITFGPPSEELAKDLAALWSKPIQYVFLRWHLDGRFAVEDIIMVKPLF